MTACCDVNVGAGDLDATVDVDKRVEDGVNPLIDLRTVGAEFAFAVLCCCFRFALVVGLPLGAPGTIIPARLAFSSQVCSQFDQRNWLERYDFDVIVAKYEKKGTQFLNARQSQSKLRVKVSHLERQNTHNVCIECLCIGLQFSLCHYHIT